MRSEKTAVEAKLEERDEEKIKLCKRTMPKIMTAEREHTVTKSLVKTLQDSMNRHAVLLLRGKENGRNEEEDCRTVSTV